MSVGFELSEMHPTLCNFISLFIITIPIFFPIASLAEIRYTEITPEDPSPVFIDTFGFTETGHIELNVTQISFSNPNPNPLNLTQIGFFFAPRMTLFDGRMYRRNHTDICYLQSDFVNIIYTFDKWNYSIEKKKSLDVDFSMSDPGVFDLYLISCLPQLQLSMDIRSSMYNLDPKTGQPNYLSAGELVNLYYLKNFGYAKISVLLFSCTSGLLRGVHISALVGLVGTGWSSVKHKIQPDAVLLPAAVVFIHILFNVVYVINNINWPRGERYILWIGYYHFMDFMSFIVLISFLGSTYRHFLHAGQVEGKATLSLRKVKLYRQIFFVVLFYNFFSASAVIVSECISLFTRYLWLGVVVGESTILVLFLFIGYNFWPEVQDKISVINNDVEIAAAETFKDERTFDLVNILTSDS